MMISKSNTYTVECDLCKAQPKSIYISTTNFEDPGDASEAARKCGFVTKQMGLIGDPLHWWCLACNNKSKSKT